jgi:hypothetical protein
MTGKNDKKETRNRDAGDTESSLQDELSRESTEGADLIGDIASNRTVSGSSSWQTLPDEDSSGSNPQSEKDSGGTHGAPGAKKKSS